MAIDNPVLGVGMYNFRNHFKNRKYNPTYVEGEAVIVAHSSYFQIWAECGTPALFLYFSLIGGSFVTVWRVRSQAKKRYYSSWIINYATMFEASLVAFVVGSTFLNRAHFDLFYHWVALVLAFGAIAMREMDDELKYPLRVGHQGGRGELELVPKSGYGARQRTSGYRRLQPRGA